MTSTRPHDAGRDRVDNAPPDPAPGLAVGAPQRAVMSPASRRNCHGQPTDGGHPSLVVADPVRDDRARWLSGAVAARLVSEPVPPVPAVPDVGQVDPDRLLTGRAAAEWLDRPLATIGRWRRSGRLPVARDADGALVVGADRRPLFRVGDVVALADRLAPHRQAPADVPDLRVPQWVVSGRVAPPDDVAAWAQARWGRPWDKLSRTARRRAWEAAHPGREHDDARRPGQERA